MPENNKTIARCTFEEIWNRGNIAVIDRRFASDYIEHSSTEIKGPQGGKQFARAIRSAFPDFRYTIQDEIAEGDRVVHRWTAHGTHTGVFQDIPPTGTRVKISGVSIYRIADGKMVEGWTNMDMLSLLKQLGAIPQPGVKSFGAQSSPR